MARRSRVDKVLLLIKLDIPRIIIYIWHIHNSAFKIMSNTFVFFVPGFHVLWPYFPAQLKFYIKDFLKIFYNRDLEINL